MTLIDLNNPNTFEDLSIKTPEERLKNYGEPDLCRLHGLDFGERIAQQGFFVEKIDYRLMVPEETFKLNSLGNGERELIFRCSK
jgi:hypothetical protein